VVWNEADRKRTEAYTLEMDDFDRAIKLDLNKADVYIDRGIARFALDEYDDAFTDFDRAIDMKPDYVVAYVTRGRVKAVLNDIRGAKVDFQNALGLAREHGEKELITVIQKDLQELNETE